MIASDLKYTEEFCKKNSHLVADEKSIELFLKNPHVYSHIPSVPSAHTKSPKEIVVANEFLNLIIRIGVFWACCPTPWSMFLRPIALDSCLLVSVLTDGCNSQGLHEGLLCSISRS